MNSYNEMKANDSVYYRDKLLGKVTVKGITHNGKDIGSVCVESDKYLYWIKGKCCKCFLNDGWIFLDDNIEIYKKI